MFGVWKLHWFVLVRISKKPSGMRTAVFYHFCKFPVMVSSTGAPTLMVLLFPPYMRPSSCLCFQISTLHFSLSLWNASWCVFCRIAVFLKHAEHFPLCTAEVRSLQPVCPGCHSRVRSLCSVLLHGEPFVCPGALSVGIFLRLVMMVLLQ